MQGVSGSFNPAYTGVREDLLALIPEGPLERVLDLGCANGATGAVLKQRFKGVHVTGVELDPELATVAQSRLDQVLVTDAVAALDRLRAEQQRFDLVLCGDILEHLSDPWGALRTIRELTRKYVIVSLPNVAHYSTILSLLFLKRFPYRDRGIHDRTHLRFFAERNLSDLFAQAELEELRRKVQYRLFERPHPLNQKVAPLLGLIPGVKGLTTFQFMSLLRPSAIALPPSAATAELPPRA
jgi:2-polyprenyl-3-methyl-5-hydroxy-6-metoxy-1,4-benzoquinol methylase